MVLVKGGAAAAVGGGVLLHGHGGEIGIGVIEQGKGLSVLQAALCTRKIFRRQKATLSWIHANAGRFWARPLPSSRAT